MTLDGGIEGWRRHAPATTNGPPTPVGISREVGPDGRPLVTLHIGDDTKATREHTDAKRSTWPALRGFLQSLFNFGTFSGLTDGQLLEQFSELGPLRRVTLPLQP